MKYDTISQKVIRYAKTSTKKEQNRNLSCYAKRNYLLNSIEDDEDRANLMDELRKNKEKSECEIYVYCLTGKFNIYRGELVWKVLSMLI